MSLGSSSLKCVGEESVEESEVPVGGTSRWGPVTGHLMSVSFFGGCVQESLSIGMSGLVIRCSSLENSPSPGHSATDPGGPS